MCTYRRYTVVQRSIQFYLDQDYRGPTELVIYNTDVEHPMVLSKELSEQVSASPNKIIRIINNNTDSVTGEPYNNIGAIRRDSVLQADGEWYICWDDDDIYLPWNIRQCVDGIYRHPDCWGWKPFRSMCWMPDPPDRLPELAGNVMEASFILNKSKVIEYGFKPHPGGGEHLEWEEKFRDNKKSIEDHYTIPGYCFNWYDQGVMRGHKQSGDFGRVDNFEYHKQNTKDFAKEALNVYDREQVEQLYNTHINVITNLVGVETEYGYVVKQELVEKYINN